MQAYIQYRCFRKQLESQSTQGSSEKLTISLPQAGIVSRQCGTAGEEEEAAPGTQQAPQTFPGDQDMIHGGEVERADLEVEITGELSRINTQETMGNPVSMTVTGVEMQANANPPFDKQFVVLFEGLDDEMNPHNWSVRKRLRCTLIMSLVGGAIEYSTVVDSHAFDQAVQGFNTDEQKLYLITGIFLIGIGLGSLFTGPVSEVFGRNPVYMVSMAIKMLESMASALVRRLIPTHAHHSGRIILRFFGGFFGSAALVCTSGAISDIWTRQERIYMYPLYTGILLMSPMISAIVDPIIVLYRSGQYVHWANLAVVGFAWILVILFLPETYIPVLLQWKARHIRKITGDRRYRAPIELRRVSFLGRLRHALSRPFLLLCKERIIKILAAYMVLVYVTLFTVYIGFPYIFTQVYNFNALFVGLSFLSCMGGVVLVTPVVYSQWRLHGKGSRFTQKGYQHMKPEFSLYLAMFGAPVIPVAVFWMGWTSRHTISPASPLVAAGLFSYGAVCVLISVSQYVTDSFTCYVASALVAVTMPRYITAGLMSLAAIPFYKRAEPGWTLTFIAILSAHIAPIPFVLYKYGTNPEP